MILIEPTSVWAQPFCEANRFNAAMRASALFQFCFSIRCLYVMCQLGTYRGHKDDETSKTRFGPFKSHRQ